MNSYEKALSDNRSLRNTARSTALTVIKQAGGLDLSPSPGLSQLNQFRDQAATRRRYSLFRGWVHAAVHAIAEAGATQPVRVGKIKGTEEKKYRGKKEADQKLEMFEDHPLLDALENPNDFQYRWQFVYSFIANICLTGWSWIVADEKEGKKKFYAIPTTWARPVHDKGPFSGLRVVNPSKPGAEVDAPILRQDQFAFAQIPDPSNPLGAIAPASAQQQAISIDDQIQSSQEVFFENGVFPSVIISVGRDPHPDVPGGIRPRLTDVQRRQVYAAIRKTSGGIANYGNPAIIDGLIENIERLSASQNEMGWEKSEKTVRTRILSAFSVHPFILGEEMIGSYAQAYVVYERFYSRVNTYLSMLSLLMTKLNEQPSKKDKGRFEKIKVVYEPCEAKDPQMEKGMWEQARQRDDVTQNEFRAWMGLPPDEDKNQSVLNKSLLTGVTGIAEKATAGAISTDQAIAMLTALGLPEEDAKKIAGDGPKEPPPGALAQPPVPPGAPPQPGQKPPGKLPKPEPKPEGKEDAAKKAIKEAVKALRLEYPTDAVVGEILDKGGTGSGNFSHAGRPGQVGGSGGGLSATKVDANGKLVMSDGSPLPVHIPRIPPAWKNVEVSTDPGSDLVAKGVDKKGRVQRVYSDAYWAGQAKKKFKKINELRSKQDAIKKEIERDYNKGNEEAAVMRVIQSMGLRPGSTADTGAEKQAYGATTLKAEHVVVNGNKVRLKFTGKKGVALDLEVSDASVAKMLIERKSKVGEGSLFKTDESKLRDYAKSKDGGGFNPKDFRTAKGTSDAAELVKARMKSPPKNEKEYKKAVRDIADVVSSRLGNTRTVALQSYIDPVVFAPLRPK